MEVLNIPSQTLEASYETRRSVTIQTPDYITICAIAKEPEQANQPLTTAQLDDRLEEALRIRSMIIKDAINKCQKLNLK